MDGETTNRRYFIISGTPLILEERLFVFFWPVKRNKKISSHRKCVEKGEEEGQTTGQGVYNPISVCLYNSYIMKNPKSWKYRAIFFQKI